MKFRKKPVVVDAFQLGKDYIPDWFFDGDRVSIHCPGNTFNVIGFLTAELGLACLKNIFGKDYNHDV